MEKRVTGPALLRNVTGVQECDATEA